LIEFHAYDEKQKGYYEAFTREWKPIEDLRLSAKDANEKKTMNTHLHIAEAYANLYRIWPEKELKKQIENLLEVFAHYIIDDKKHHLHLFFDENWNIKSDIISYERI
jgi:mannobiose 2-epimerase